MLESQARESIAGRWQSNCDARLDWAFEAYARLISSLSTDVSSRMASAHAEAYVVVFGRTQVGKTTLLLELMGVEGHSMDRVSTVLRGGRGKGQSATATAMEYGRSSDTTWALQMSNRPTERYEDDAAASAALGELRHQMENQTLHLEGPVRLDIPCDCFLPVQDGHARVRMLDLPGDQASNPIEQQHVERVAGRYVAGADLILLVGKMDDLSFLKPGGLLLPGIEDWQIVPDRFRIITTYSFTAASVQASVRKHGLQIEHIRARLLEQLETFERLSPDARRPDLLFPLEFGQSLARTSLHDPGLVRQIEPIVESLKAELIDEINTATTPMARLRGTLRSHLTVAKVKEQKLKAMDEACEDLMKSLESARADLDVASAAAKANAKRHHTLSRRQEQLLQANPKASVSTICALDESTLTKAVGQGDKSVRALQGRLDKFRGWIRQSYLALSATSHVDSMNLAWFWRGVRIPLEDDLPAIRQLLDEHLSSVESHLNGYWTDGYWIDDSFENDVAKVMAAMTQATAACRTLASRRWRRAIEKQRQALQQKLDESAQVMKPDKQLLRDLKRKVDVASDAVSRFEVQRDAFEERMVADQERCRAFTELLDESYAQQLAALRRRMRRSKDPALALVDLLSSVQLIDTRSQLLATGSFANTPDSCPTH
jgi:hypothetical protein